MESWLGKSWSIQRFQDHVYARAVWSMESGEMLPNALFYGRVSGWMHQNESCWLATTTDVYRFVRLGGVANVFVNSQLRLQIRYSRQLRCFYYGPATLLSFDGREVGKIRLPATIMGWKDVFGTVCFGENEQISVFLDNNRADTRLWAVCSADSDCFEAALRLENVLRDERLIDDYISSVGPLAKAFGYGDFKALFNSYPSSDRAAINPQGVSREFNREHSSGMCIAISLWMGMWLHI